MLFCRYKIRVNARDFYETWFWNTEVDFVSGVGNNYLCSLLSCIVDSSFSYARAS